MDTTKLIDDFKNSSIGTAVLDGATGIKGPRTGIEIIRKLTNNSNKIIGLPPITAYHSLFQSQLKSLPFSSEIEIKTENDWHVLASSTVLRLIPALPKFSGMESASNTGEIFSMDYNAGAKKYISLLKNAGVDPRYVNQSSNNRVSVDVAVLSNFNLSESFNSTYEESMIESGANTASNFVNQIRPLAPEIGTVAGKVTDMASLGIKGAFSALGLENAGNVAGNVAKTAGMVATGNKVDFPQIWSSSSYSPSYRFTTLLYNPWPDDPSIGNEDFCYNKYIVEPLAHLMGFMMPISSDGISYTYPVLCGAYGGGLINVNAGYIETFDINVGGASSDISFLQRPNIIEVDFTIKHLYSTMIGYVSDGAAGSKQISEERPSFKGFVSSLRSFAVVESKFSDLNDTLGSTISRAANEIEAIARRQQPDPQDVLFDSEGRLNISDEIAASDPTLLEDSEFPQQLQARIAAYRNDIQQFIDRGIEITPEIAIALRIRNGIPTPEDWIQNFYANSDKIDPNVFQIAAGESLNVIFDSNSVIPSAPTQSEGNL